MGEDRERGLEPGPGFDHSRRADQGQRNECLDVAKLECMV